MCSRNFSKAAAASILLPPLNLWTNYTKHCASLFHYLKIENMPLSFIDVKNVVKACTDCGEVKAKFLKPEKNFNLGKLTKSFERISYDFKGPLPNTSGDK